MGPYTCAKAGVEALTDALRTESALNGVAVGCAYFGFIDTDLVRASFAQESTQAMTGQMPAFMRNPAPLSKAIDAIERGIERRAARLWAPRWVGALLVARGIFQPLTERMTQRDPERLREGVRLARESAAEDDPLLGVSAKAIAESPSERVGA
jgi:NAD(P)-dependent dehydrogenase (short-subunit alcohol dehydrogenase family)